jgi:hypothetical protein
MRLRALSHAIGLISHAARFISAMGRYRIVSVRRDLMCSPNLRFDIYLTGDLWHQIVLCSRRKP